MSRHPPDICKEKEEDETMFVLSKQVKCVLLHLRTLLVYCPSNIMEMKLHRLSVTHVNNLPVSCKYSEYLNKHHFFPPQIEFRINDFTCLSPLKSYDEEQVHLKGRRQVDKRDS